MARRNPYQAPWDRVAPAIFHTRDLHADGRFEASASGSTEI